MIGVEVRSNFKQVIAEFTPRHQGVIDKATIRALNRALDSTQTVANRKIRERYNVKMRAVSAAMKKKRAHRGQNYAFARLEIRGARIPLIEFSARPVNPWNIRGRKHRLGGGVSLRILRQGSRKLIRHAFITAATRNNARGGGSAGMKQVFMQAGRIGGFDMRGTDYESIRSLRSVSIPQQFSNKVVRAAVDAAAREAFEKNFRQQIKFLSGA